MEYKARVLLGWKSVTDLGNGIAEKYVYQVKWRVRPGMLFWHRSAWTDTVMDENSSVSWTKAVAASSSSKVKLHWRQNEQPFQSTVLQLQLIASPRKFGSVKRFLHRKSVAYAEVPFSRIMRIPREYNQACTMSVSLQEQSSIIEGYISPYHTAVLCLSFRQSLSSRGVRAGLISLHQ